LPSKNTVVPLTEAVAVGLETLMEALVPAGGFTSIRTLPAWRDVFKVSVPAAALISTKVKRVRGCTVISALFPTAIKALLLNPVDTTVSCLTWSPIPAATKSAAPACFSSTVPLNCRITPAPWSVWAKTLKHRTKKKSPKTAFFIVSFLNINKTFYPGKWTVKTAK
jgi:hypothetical protein